MRRVRAFAQLSLDLTRGRRRWTAVGFAAIVSAALCWAPTDVRSQDPPPLDPPVESEGSDDLLEPLYVTPSDSFYGPELEYGDNITSFGYSLWDPGCRDTRYYRSPAFGRLWFGAEILGWATKGSRLPPLVTASPAGTPLVDAGELGRPTTTILFGDELVHDELRAGGRLTGGWWFDLEQTAGIEASYFGVGGDDIDFYQAGDGTNILARPYFNVNTGQQDALLIAFPTTIIGPLSVTANGTIGVEVDMELSGAEVIYRRLISSSPVHRCELVAGYRYGRLDDQLGINEGIDLTSVGPLSTTQIVGNRLDLFRAVNSFHGGELGFIANRWWNRLSLQLLGKIALGASTTRINIDGRTVGETTTTPLIGPVTVTPFDNPFGWLAQPSNIGRFDETEFAALAELGVGLEYVATCQLKFTLGYSLIYWTDVARAFDQVDLAVDPTQVQQRPRLPLATTEFWAQGLRGGLVYQF